MMPLFVQAKDNEIPKWLDGTDKETNFNYGSLGISKNKNATKEKIDNEFFITVPFSLQKKLTCRVTPILKLDKVQKPKIFNFTNNLRRESKKPFLARGDIIYIRGIVRDVNCTPIQNALIQLWQNGGYGSDKAESGKASASSKELYDQNFVGTGTAISDNLGRFEFITILPGASGGEAPNLNFFIKSLDFGEVNTKIFFPSHLLNSKDKKLQSLEPYNQELLMSELVPVNLDNLAEGYFMIFEITLNGISRYRHL